MVKNKLIVPGIAVLGVVAGLTTANIAANAEGTSTTTNATSNTSKSTGTDANVKNSHNGPAQGAQPPQGAPTGPHQANGKTEAALTGDSLAKATEAAKAKVAGATVDRAESDVDGDGTYEVHMTKSDGSKITVFLDGNFAVTSTQDGMGKGGGPNGPQAPRQDSSNNSANVSNQ